MSAFPWDFDYETLITDEDRELDKLALAQYSREAAMHIAYKYYVEKTLWPEYKRKVLALIARKMPESDFLNELEKLKETKGLFILL